MARKERPSCFGAHFESGICMQCGHEQSCSNKKSTGKERRSARGGGSVYRKPHAINSDERLNPTLKDEVQSLRGEILATAKVKKLPERFKSLPHANLPRMIITDTYTGRKTEVPLYAYGEVIRAISSLFDM